MQTKIIFLLALKYDFSTFPSGLEKFFQGPTKCELKDGQILQNIIIFFLFALLGQKW